MEGEGPQAEAAGARFYLPVLDGLRFVAFLLVFYLHGTYIPLQQEGLGDRLGKFKKFGIAASTLGEAGVAIFFVLSAFLITRLLLMERERTGRIDVRAFIIRRALRIWPLYFAFLALVPPLLGGVPAFGPTPVSPESRIWYLFFCGDLYHAFHGPGPLAVLWTLGVEEKFYLLWPWVLAALDERGVRRAAFALVGAGFVSTIICGAANDLSLVRWFPLNHGVAFGAGTLLALAKGRPAEARRSSGAVIGAFLLGLLAVYWLPPVVIHFMPAVDSTLWPHVWLLFGGALCSAACLHGALQIRSGFLLRPLVVLFGRWSYGAYLLHIVPLLLVSKLTPGYGVGHWAAILLSLAITLGLAAASYRYLERPFLRLKGRFERVPSRPV